MKPQARQEGLLVRELEGEVVVYDLDRHEAHCLNLPAAAVFRLCDGRRTLGDLTQGLREELGAAVDEQWVGLALEGLDAANLLARSSRPPVSASNGRRDLLRQAGLGAALLLPAIVSMVAPTPAEAANSCIPEASCTSTPQPCYQPIGTPADCPVCLCTAPGVCAC